MVTTKTIVKLVLILSFMVTCYIMYNTPSRTERKAIMSEYLKRTRKSSSSLRKTKKKLLLFVGIHSAPSHLDRRNAIRETWMKECRRNPNAVCRFFTDGQDPKGEALQGEKRIKLESESRVYGDLLLAEAPGGVNFALKYLWMLQWANERYDFQYFLRLDDDYFICFQKLMLELAIFRPKEKFQWGWLHCSTRGIWMKIQLFLHGSFSEIWCANNQYDHAGFVC